MDTDPDHGTLREKIADAYLMYFNEVGLTCSATYFTWTNEGKYVVGELQNDRPCHLSVIYNNDWHSVIAVGYSKYIYSGGAESLYIQIADGWANYPDRYVWAGTASNWKMTSVIPR